MGALGRYTIVAALPRGSNNQTVLAIRESGGDRQGVVLRPWDAGAPQRVPPALPGLVPVLGFDEHKGLPVAIYDFSPGVTLREILEAFRASQRRAPLGLAGRVVLDAARVVSALHAQAEPLVHGCLHDGAVLVGFDGVVRLIDVGGGRRSRFEAPEVAQGEAPTLRSDVYGLAALMHAAATGFASAYAQVGVRGAASSDLPPPSRHHADASPELDAALNRALATNPAARMVSARLFADELERALAGRLYGREQVGGTLSELFGDRVAALKSLVVKATAAEAPPAQRPSRPRGTASELPAVPRPSGPRGPASETPTAPRPSGPKGTASETPTVPRPSGPKPRSSRPGASPPEAREGSGVPEETQAGQDRTKVLARADALDPNQGRAERPRASAPGAGRRGTRPGLVEAQRPGPGQAASADGADAEAPSPGIEDVPTAMRPRVTGSRPALTPQLKQQTEEEKAAAAGQERISTADLEPESLGELAQLQDDAPPPQENEPTDVKQRPAPPPGRRPLEAEPPRRRQRRSGGKLLLTFLLLAGVFGGLAYKLRPWRGKPLPAWTPPRVLELLVEDGALPPGGEPEVVQLTEADVAPPLAGGPSDGGAPAEAEAAPDAGGPGAGAAPPPEPDGDPSREDAGAD